MCGGGELEAGHDRLAPDQLRFLFMGRIGTGGPSLQLRRKFDGHHTRRVKQHLITQKHARALRLFRSKSVIHKIEISAVDQLFSSS